MACHDLVAAISLKLYVHYQKSQFQANFMVTMFEWQLCNIFPFLQATTNMTACLTKMSFAVRCTRDHSATFMAWPHGCKHKDNQKDNNHKDNNHRDMCRTALQCRKLTVLPPFSSVYSYLYHCFICVWFFSIIKKVSESHSFYCFNFIFLNKICTVVKCWCCRTPTEKERWQWFRFIFSSISDIVE